MSNRDTDDIEESAAPLIEHLAELRTRLIRSVIAFIVGIVIAFTVAEPILQFLLEPIEATLRDLGDPSPTMQYTSPQEYLFTLFRISMVFGFALAFPVIGLQMWRFVAPGLYRSEKKCLSTLFDRLASDVPSGGEFCPFCRHAFGDGLFPRICGCEFGFCDPNSVGDKQWGCRNDCRSGNGQRYQHNLFWQGK